MSADKNGPIEAMMAVLAILLAATSLSACAGMRDAYTLAAENYVACKAGLQQAASGASPASLDRTVNVCEASLEGAEFTEAPRMAAQAHIARDRARGDDHHPEIVRLLVLGVNRARSGDRLDWRPLVATCELLSAERRPGDPECGRELLRQAALEKARLDAWARYYASLPDTPRRSSAGEDDGNRMMHEGYEFMRMQQEMYEKR